MEVFRDFGRRLRRGADVRRRVLLPLALIAFVVLYLAPAAFRLLWGSRETERPAPPACLRRRLEPYRDAAERGDAAVWADEGGFPAPPPILAHVANGLFAVSLEGDARIRIRAGPTARTLSLPVDFMPVVRIEGASEPSAGGTVLDYLSGLVHRHDCHEGFEATHTYYAHRATPSLFGQEIRIANPGDVPVEVRLRVAGADGWADAVGRAAEVRRAGGGAAVRYSVHTGPADPRADDGKIAAVTIALKAPPPTVTVAPRGAVTLDVHAIVEYGEPVQRDRYQESADAVEKRALRNAERIAELGRAAPPKETHAEVWKRLWTTGFSISESKATDALNGDRINATIYAVASQLRTPEHEEDATAAKKAEISKAVGYAESCYEGHFTLEAENLWKPLDEWRKIDAVVGAWLITLEKHGCHRAIGAGASGAVQAMVLSFGGLRFSSRHLEFNARPSDLHRDFHFRRLNYGNLTRVNISVVVQDDDKAALYAAIEGSDGGFFGCDAGCLDGPVPLGPARRYFPVKLTDPPTAILYITSDRSHLEDLRHAIHVKEVAMAPPHERHVLALHKHGHSLGGLPTVFWVSICFIIVVFHLFLCRIIMTEYCDPPDKYRRLYAKP